MVADAPDKLFKVVVLNPISVGKVAIVLPVLAIPRALYAEAINDEVEEIK